MLRFYNERWQAARLNAAHLALVDLERAYDVRIVTLNGDDLHERAGFVVVAKPATVGVPEVVAGLRSRHSATGAAVIGYSETLRGLSRPFQPSVRHQSGPSRSTSSVCARRPPSMAASRSGSPAARFFDSARSSARL